MAEIDQEQNEMLHDSRPQISTEVDRHSKHLTSHELDYLQNLHHEEHLKKKKKTVMDMTLNEIVENTVNFTAHFSRDYSHKLYEVDLDFKTHEDEGGFFSSLKKYLLAFTLYLSDNDNILYFGIILVLLSIILYFFNITSS